MGDVTVIEKIHKFQRYYSSKRSNQVHFFSFLSFEPFDNNNNSKKNVLYDNTICPLEIENEKKERKKKLAP